MGFVWSKIILKKVTQWILFGPSVTSHMKSTSLGIESLEQCQGSWYQGSHIIGD